MRHELKIWPVFYKMIVDGRKSCEIRLDDREYREGDQLDLYEYDANDKAYTGQHHLVQVTLILQGHVCHLTPGYVSLFIEPTTDKPMRLLHPGEVRCVQT